MKPVSELDASRPQRNLNRVRVRKSNRRLAVSIRHSQCKAHERRSRLERLEDLRHLRARARERPSGELGGWSVFVHTSSAVSSELPRVWGLVDKQRARGVREV